MIQKVVWIKRTSILTYKKNKTANVTYVNGKYYQAKYEVWGSEGVISLDRAYSVPSDFITKINLQYNIENTWEGRKNEIIEIARKRKIKVYQAIKIPFKFKIERELIP